MSPKNFLVRFPPWKSVSELVDFPAFDLDIDGVNVKIMEWDGDDVPLAELPLVWVQVKGIPPKNSAWRSFALVITSCGILMDVDWGSFFKSFYAEIRVQVVCRDPVKIPKEMIMEFEQKLYLLKLKVEGVEQIEEDDALDDPSEDFTVNEGFDELEDPNESSHLMDTGRVDTHSPRPHSRSGNYKTCSMFPECWDELELPDVRLNGLQTKCQSWNGEETIGEWVYSTPASFDSLPSKLDYDKMDMDVWEFEPQSVTLIDNDALSQFEKSANAAYCSQVLSSFNLDDSDEDMSDCGGVEEKSNDGMKFLPQDVVDRLGSVRKNLFPTLEKHSHDNAIDVETKCTAPKAEKQKWAPVVAISRMATRNHGHVNVIDKAKEYQKRKNLEIPPSFKGNSYASLPVESLCDMAEKVNLRIGHNSHTRMDIVQTIVDKELVNNLNFARNNPCTVLPASIDVCHDLVNPTLPGTDHQLPGVSSILLRGSRIVDSNLILRPGMS
ncbi:hypothetical protein ACQ4PT_004783 [Festuca glaucescens]